MNIKLSIEALEVLDAIDRKGSFAAAAESLFRVPSAITYTIRQLEEDLGVVLFDRSGHRAKLTDAGAELLREGRFLLRAADELQARVKRVASGIETDISIAVTDLFRVEALYPSLEKFYAQGFGTRIKVIEEVFGGAWDALTTGRADIAIGAPDDGPSGGGYSTSLIGPLEFCFAVAKHHPLASLQEPLSNQQIMQYRAVSAADSSRNLPPRTSGILSGQDVLTLMNMHSKLLAQIYGLGVGYLPKSLAEKYAARGDLVIKKVAESKSSGNFHLAWHTSNGKALTWLIKELSKLTLDELII